MTLDNFCNIHHIEKDNLLKAPKRHKLNYMKQVYTYLQFMDGEHPVSISKTLGCHRTTIYNSVKNIRGFIQVRDKEIMEVINKSKDNI